MGNGIVRFSVKTTPRGTMVTAHKRSRRGTMYISQNALILRTGKSRKEIRQEIADVVVKMDEGRSSN